LLFAAATTQAEPKLTFSENEFDFGYIPQHAVVSHVFWIYSSGDAPVHIIKIVPGCSCTRMPVERDILPVGDSLRLVLTFDSRVYRGAVSKHPKIYTDQADSVNTLIFHANATARPDTIKPVQIVPYKLDISQYADHVRDKIDFEIKNVSNQDLDLNLVAYPKDLVTVQLPSKVAAGQSASATVTINPDVLDKNFERSFTFQVNDKDASRFTVPMIRKIEKPKTNARQASAGK
jgi:hypothetical protein